MGDIGYKVRMKRLCTAELPDHLIKAVPKVIHLAFGAMRRRGQPDSIVSFGYFLHGFGQLHNGIKHMAQGKHADKGAEQDTD